jgi:hypothetical protein
MCYATIDGSCMHVLITEVVGPIVYLGLEHGMVITNSCTIIVRIIIIIVGINDAPPSPLMDSTESPNVKTTKGKGVGVRSLVRSTSGVEGCARVLGWD